MSEAQLNDVREFPDDWERAVGTRWVYLTEEAKQRVVDTLCDALDRSGPLEYDYRLAVVNALGRLQSQRCVRSLVMALREGDPFAERVKAVLEGIDLWRETTGAAEAREDILRELQKPGGDWARRYGCVYALGVIADPRDVRVLAAQFRRGHRQVRPLAEIALRRIGTREALQALRTEDAS